MQDDIKNLSLPLTFAVDRTFDSDRFIKLRLRFMHSGNNPNGSYFSLDSMEKSKDTLKNIPILANVIIDKDGNIDHGSHDFHIEDDLVNDGESRIIYDERPVGMIPETNNYEVVESDGKSYAYTDGFLWVGYAGYSEDIVKRDSEIKISMEIEVSDFVYESKTGVYNIIDYAYKGITLLGKNVGTGMVNARATTKSFSENETQELFTLMSELKQEIEKNQSSKEVEINGEFNKETEDKLLNEKLELFSKYNLKPEDLNLNLEEVSLEDLEAKLIAFGKPQEDPKLLEFATFREKYEAVARAVRSMDSSENYTFHSLIDFDDQYLYIERYVWSDSGYTNSYGRITYSFDGETNSATVNGEWETIYLMWLTEEEKGKLESARAEYETLQSAFESYKESHATENTVVSELVSFKNERLAEDRKFAEEEIFTKFEKLNGNEEFENLKANSSNFELNELTDKCFEIFGKTTANFAINTQKKKTLIKIPVASATPTESKNNLYDKFFEEYKTN